MRTSIASLFRACVVRLLFVRGVAYASPLLHLQRFRMSISSVWKKNDCGWGKRARPWQQAQINRSRTLEGLILVKLFTFLVGFLAVVAAGSTADGENLSLSRQPQQSKAPAWPLMDYASLIDNLRTAGVNVESEGEEVDQPFFSVEGRIIKVSGEDVQVFQYGDAAAADAQAALVAPDGSSVGTSKLHWVGPPHFYKKGKLLVLYVGGNAKALKALEAVLGRQFAGKED